MRTVGGRLGVALFSLIIACGDDDGGGDGATEPDGSTGGGSDGGGPVGDGGGTGDAGETPDASPLDASSDASPDAGSGLVTVTVSLPPFPTAGTIVFFMRPDNSVIDVVVIGEEGRAQAMFDESGVVVIYFPAGPLPGSQYNIFAYLSVPPGSDILHGSQPIPAQTATLTVNGPAVIDAVGYRVDTVCGTAAAPVPTVVVPVEVCPPQTHVLWTTQFLQNGQLQSLTAFTPTVDVQTGTITVGGELRPDLVQTSRFTGLPDYPFPDMNYHIFGQHGPVQFGREHISQEPQDGVLEVTDQFHDLRQLGLVGQQTILLTTPVGSLIDLRAWVDHDGAPTVDVTDLLPPVVLTSSFARATGTWVWTEDGTGSASMVHGAVFPGETSVLGAWNVIGPRDGLALTMPRLPPPYDDLNIEPTTSLLGGANLHLYHRTGGYQRFVSDFHGASTGATGTAGERLVIIGSFPVVE